jgi:flavodoxin
MFLLVGLASAASSVLSAEKRVLICWFSRSGTTKRVVDVLLSQLNADMFEITVDADYKGVIGLFRSLWHCFCKTRPALTRAVPDFSKYDAIVIAGPVWNWDLPPPLASFLAAADFGGRPVVPLGTADSNMGKYVENLGASLKNGKFVRSAGFTAVGKETRESLAEKVKVWASGAADNRTSPRASEF